jgi:hypothetical protein
MTIGLENSLFAGSDQGGLLAASIYSLLETAKLKGVERSAWRSCTITIAPTTQPAAPPSCCRGIIAQPGPTTSPGCGSAWKRDPVSGVIGVEKGPLILVF